jgi:hypothetical protein
VPALVVLGEAGEVLHGAHAVALEQGLAAGHGHARDLQDVAVPGDLRLAVGAAAAAGDVVGEPAHRFRRAHVGRGHGLEALPALAVDGQEVPDVEARLLPVPQDQRDPVRDGDPGRGQLIRVGGELQQRRDLGVAGELGVVDGVGAVRLADQEVGAAVEAAVVEGGLEDDVGALPQRPHGLLVLGGQGRVVHPAGRLDLVDPAAPALPGLLGARRRRRPERPVPRLEVLQDGGLVLVAQPGGALQHGVLGDIQAGDAAQLLVQDAQSGPGALGGAHEVAGRVDERAGRRDDVELLLARGHRGGGGLHEEHVCLLEMLGLPPLSAVTRGFGALGPA